MKKGGYQIIDLSRYSFSDTKTVYAQGVYDILEGTRKVILVSGLEFEGEEFKDMLIAFRDKDPNGNGVQDEIPLVNLNHQGLLHLLNAFCYWDGSNIEVDNDTVNFVATSEE